MITVKSGNDEGDKQIARIERQRNPGSAARLAPDVVSLNPGYARDLVVRGKAAGRLLGKRKSAVDSNFEDAAA